MTTILPVQNSVKRTRILSIIGNLAPVVVFFFVIVLFFPIREVFQADSDEGVELIKAAMLHRNYELYEDVWSDQPPLFTIALRVLIDLFGARVGLMRTFVLLLSSLMFFSCYQILRIRWSTLHAITGAVLLFFTPSYGKLSTSVMIGLPSIAFAFVAVFLLLFWHRSRNYWALSLSSLAMAVSIGIKLFTGFIGVIIVVGLVVAEINRVKHDDRGSWLQIFFPAVIWGIGFTIFTALWVIFLVGAANIPELFEIHQGGIAIEQFQGGVYTINYHLKSVAPLLFLGLIGTYLSVRQKRYFFLYFTAWSLTAYLLLLNHTPVWYHHAILVSTPAAILSAVAVGYFIDQIYQKRDQLKHEALLILILAGIVGVFFDVWLPDFVREFRIPSNAVSVNLTIQEEILMARIQDAKPETNWFVTDMLMYAVRRDLPVPPNLAVFSMKRYYSGALTENDIIETIRQYAPEQILLGRSEYPMVSEFLTTDYQLIEQFRGNVRYYVRSDLVSQTFGR